MAQCKAALGKTQGQEVSSELSSTVVASFAKYQAKAQAEYENKVVKTLLAKKAELEKVQSTSYCVNIDPILF